MFAAIRIDVVFACWAFNRLALKWFPPFFLSILYVGIGTNNYRKLWNTSDAMNKKHFFDEIIKLRSRRRRRCSCFHIHIGTHMVIISCGTCNNSNCKLLNKLSQRARIVRNNLLLAKHSSTLFRLHRTYPRMRAHIIHEFLQRII